MQSDPHQPFEPPCLHATDSTSGSLLHPAINWFAARGWQPFAYQIETWQTYLQGGSGLLHAPTGTGKTLALWFGPILEWFAQSTTTGFPSSEPTGLQVLWITPLRALAKDTAAALRGPILDLGLPWTVELRTGDTPASLKQKQRRSLPSALVTTPESLSLLLSYPESRSLFASLRAVVVDEWHELLGTKRGTQTELALARLRRFSPEL
jgi:ATP-dependent helicase Lhr and Lhr-like helicase